MKKKSANTFPIHSDFANVIPISGCLPVFNPNIVIVFVKEYRNFILVVLKLRKPSEQTVKLFFRIIT
ncbi:unnamed protein product, partial [Haemonchus placei]|uniref:Uncharacterized protein n=1 Tax=Haemonchus placei TaxID=6290 RepID=A0A0N4X9R5_HAEPC